MIILESSRVPKEPREFFMVSGLFQSVFGALRVSRPSVFGWIQKTWVAGEWIRSPFQESSNYGEGHTPMKLCTRGER